MSVWDLLIICHSKQNVSVCIGCEAAHTSLSGSADALSSYLAESVTNSKVDRIVARGDALVVWIEEPEEA